MTAESTATRTSGRPLLEVHDIHKRFGSNEVLKGVSLTARAGDVISIIGSSGSGKSTLLRCINLLEKPNTGRIVLAGEELQLKADRQGELQAVQAAQLQRLRLQHRYPLAAACQFKCGRQPRQAAADNDAIGLFHARQCRPHAGLRQAAGVEGVGVGQGVTHQG